MMKIMIVVWAVVLMQTSLSKASGPDAYDRFNSFGKANFGAEKEELT